jgi:guanine deaminase
VLAHGIWLDAADRALAARHRAQVAHSPSSNLFLGRGCCDWRALEDAGVPVTDGQRRGRRHQPVDAAHDGRRLQGAGDARHRLPAWKALHTATRGAAQALGLAHEIGSFDTGCLADLALWRWAPGRWPQCATPRPGACMNACSPG